MSHLSHSHHRNTVRAQSAAAVSQHLSRSHAAVGDYTLVHGGRQVRIGPVAFWIVVGTLVIMAVWSIGTGTYFAFRDDVLSGLISRHARMQIAYEDRIAALRGQVDRITSRQLLDQEQFERRLDALLKRQATLERRTTALTDDTLTPARSTATSARRTCASRRRSRPPRSTTPSCSARRPSAKRACNRATSPVSARALPRRATAPDSAACWRTSPTRSTASSSIKARS